MTIKSAFFATLVGIAPIASVSAQEQPPAAVDVQVDDLIEQLGDRSWRVRKEATAKLEKVGKQALDDLRIAAEDHDDPEVRMRLNRILRRIELGDEPTARMPQRWNDDVRSRSRSFPDRDELRAMLDEMLDRRLDSQRLLDRLMQDRDIDAGIDGATSSERVNINIGPDGVRVEIGKDGDSEIYEADDMDAFRREYPEIAKQYLDGGSNRLRVFGFDSKDPFRMDLDLDEDEMREKLRRFHLDVPPGLTLPRTWSDARRALTPLDPRQDRVPEGRRLGVQVEGLHPVLGEFLGFDEGEGLRIVSVVEDSLAGDLGLEEGDVLLAINGHEILSRADVAEELGKIEAGKSVEVRVNRKGRPVDLNAEKRQSAEKAKTELRRTK